MFSVPAPCLGTLVSCLSGRGCDISGNRRTATCVAALYPHGLGKTNLLFEAYCDLSELVRPDNVTVLLSGEQAVPDKVHDGDSLILYVEGAEAVQAFKRANRFVGS